MSKIEWTGETWNPVVGCTRISEGCRNCYAEAQHNKQYGIFLKKGEKKENQWHFPFGKIQELDERLVMPKSWKVPTLVFVNSVSDLFHEGLREDYIRQVFDVMVAHPHLIFQVLTKRAERMAALAPSLPWPNNIWMGVTVEDERVLDRTDFLRLVPAHLRWLSCEPLIGPLPDLNLEGIHWVVAGGESGKEAREPKVEWFRLLRDQCQATDVPFFFKQWGKADFNPSWMAETEYWRNEMAFWDARPHHKVEVKRPKGGALLDGVRYINYPIPSLLERERKMTNQPPVPQQPVQPPAIAPGYDYFGITDPANLQAVQGIKSAIQNHMQQTLDQVVAIGHQLNLAKPFLGERLIDWADQELGISKATAYNFMGVATKFKDNPNFPRLGKLPLDAVYALATHTVPVAAEDEVLQRLDSGERMTVQLVREIITKHRSQIKASRLTTLPEGNAYVAVEGDEPERVQGAQPLISTGRKSNSASSPLAVPMQATAIIEPSEGPMVPPPQPPVQQLTEVAVAVPEVRELLGVVRKTMNQLRDAEFVEAFQKMDIQDREEAIQGLTVLLEKAREAHTAAHEAAETL